MSSLGGPTLEKKKIIIIIQQNFNFNLVFFFLNSLFKSYSDSLAFNFCKWQLHFAFLQLLIFLNSSLFDVQLRLEHFTKICYFQHDRFSKMYQLDCDTPKPTQPTLQKQILSHLAWYPAKVCKQVKNGRICKPLNQARQSPSLNKTPIRRIKMGGWEDG